MQRDIVVFETNDEVPVLDFRLIRGALPSGSSPLAIATHSGFPVEPGQFFSREDVAAFAEKQSGYRSVLSQA